MREDTELLLQSYINAQYPIIYIDNTDFKAVDRLIAGVAGSRNIIEYINAIGKADFRKNNKPQHKCSLLDFLEHEKDCGYDEPCFIILKDIHDRMTDMDIIGLLKYIAERNVDEETEYNAVIFIVSSKMIIPDELKDYITVVDIPLPDADKIKHIIKPYFENSDEKELDGIAELLKGQNEYQIKQSLRLFGQSKNNDFLYQIKKSMGLFGNNNEFLFEFMLKQKEQTIKKSGLLEMIRTDESIDSIGGLGNLKKWLVTKAKIFNELSSATKFGVDIPKGIMIVGMPGCGKSLAAKTTSNLFKMPLLRLDIGRILGKYVGESEENMRKALRLAESISPCVVWIDEIEKAFSGVGGPGGANDVTTRLFGQFLTWMQENKSSVFIVATANDISHIPAEFLRKGRFDELFYVDFPDEKEREKIMEIHLKKRNKFNCGIDIHSVVKDEKDSQENCNAVYSGADIEEIVKKAIENCYISGQYDITTEALLEAKKEITPMSKNLKKRIEEIRQAVENYDLKKANGDMPVSFSTKDTGLFFKVLADILNKSDEKYKFNLSDYSDIPVYNPQPLRNTANVNDTMKTWHTMADDKI